MQVASQKNKWFLSQAKDFAPIVKRIAQYKWRIIRNVLFWLAYGGMEHLATLYMGKGEIEDGRFWAITLTKVLSFAFPIYLNNSWLIPHFLQKKKYLAFSGLLVLCFAVFGAFATLLHQILYSSFPSTTLSNPGLAGGLVNIIFELIMLVVATSLFHLALKSFVYRRQVEKIEQVRLKMEVENLKAQINPHFLFNALNTVYGLTSAEETRSRGAIVQLSDILRYVLYECNAQKVNLQKEIVFIKDYVGFSSLRAGEEMKVEANYPKQVSTKALVPPMIFMPLIENAFKHATSDGARWIKLNMEMHGEYLTFEIANSYSGQPTKNTAIKSGLGLENVKKRLELLFDQRYEWLLTKAQGEFRINLKIPIEIG